MRRRCPPSLRDMTDKPKRMIAACLRQGKGGENGRRSVYKELFAYPMQLFE